VSSLVERAGEAGETTPDPVLIERCLSGEAAAYTVIVRRYQRRVFNFASRLVRQRELAEEVSQEAFFLAYQKLDSCRQPDRFFPWLLRITRNLAINAVRRAHLATVPLEGVTEPSGLVDSRSVGPDGPEGAIEGKETAAELERRVLGLPPKYRAAILLRHVEDRTYEEIAEILEVPLGTVKFRLHRAYKLLKERLFKR
jgi:RNA polymerase sigma-70 factor (ECF subfamily)